ncbi:MAG TPA: ATP-binding protein, partial [Ramlibacter sp.]
IGQVVRLFEELGRRHGVVLHARWEGPAGERYLLDADRVRQMLCNLVDNALKFTRDGQVHIEGRELSRSGAAAVLAFSVSDTGEGVAPGELERLFEPFTQGEGARGPERGGTGLGLSIVRRLARLMGGDAHAESERGRGSRFSFQIKAELVDAGSGTGTSLPPSGLGELAEPVAPRPGRVLVVEDNAINRQVLEAMLAMLGLEVACATDGVLGARSATADPRPDAVLVDCEMPLLDGYGATRKIREWERYHGRERVPVIAVTADAFPETCDRCIAAGMDDVITKPVSLGQLRAKLLPRLKGARGGQDQKEKVE